jgi:hypothetical protein
MQILFTILVVLGFLFQLLATWPLSPYMVRLAWGSWLVAAIIWAVGAIGIHAAH